MTVVSLSASEFYEAGLALLRTVLRTVTIGVCTLLLAVLVGLAFE